VQCHHSQRIRKEFQGLLSRIWGLLGGMTWNHSRYMNLLSWTSL
jgi:hypothetical protein